MKESIIVLKHQNQIALTILKKVDAESLQSLPKCQFNIKNQLNKARVFRLSLCFL